jgi:hypothetical protein
MGEYGNGNMFRDWQTDPKKLGDPIKPIEVSWSCIDFSLYTATNYGTEGF